MNSQPLILINLPKSILEQIFLNLNSYQILQVQLVNKQFREILKPIIFNLIDITSWKGNLIEDTLKDPKFLLIIKNYGNYCTKFMSRDFDQLMPNIRYLPNLSNIFIKHGIELSELEKLKNYTRLNSLGCLKFKNLENLGVIENFKCLTRLQLDIGLDLLVELIYSKVINTSRIEHLILELPQLYIPLVNLITLKFRKLTKLVICSTNQSTTLKEENRIKLPKQSSDLLELKECSIRIFYDFTIQSNDEWLIRDCLFINYWLNLFRKSPILKLNLKTPPIPEEFLIFNNNLCNSEFDSNLVQLSSYKLPNLNTLKFHNLTNLTLQYFKVNFQNLSDLCKLENLRRLTINLVKLDNSIMIPHLPFTLDGCLNINRLEFPYGHFKLEQLVKLMSWFPNTREFSCFTIGSSSTDGEESEEEENLKNVELPFQHINIIAQTQSKTQPTIKLIKSCKNLISIKLPRYMLTYLNYNKEGKFIKDEILLGDPLGVWFSEKLNDFNLIN